ncbi:MAG TPA: division/cell wall cluster transcriptional repressor MraZ [Candidatus Baltobacteraceae bacterium]|nr:division/cell wall cluster transcriptional repressor MraZ [Candidatus Baltobacteraceae bacterium]
MHADLPRFTGYVEHALDDKGRLIVPARFRERLGTGFILTIAEPDRCLALYPEATWGGFCDRLEAAPRKDDRYRRFVRHLFAHTEEVACDSQGRLLLPAALRTYAGIDRDVVSIGSFTRVEIWAKDRYAAHAAPEGEVADFMAELGLY